MLFFNGNLSEEFSINYGVKHGCPLSPILFNLFINDVLDNRDKYGVYLDSQYYCGGLFADDIVLVAPSKQALKTPMKWTVFPGPWRVDGKGITYIRCTNYSFL